MSVFMHIDMDAFFAAIEELDHPDFRGKPVIVGADPKGGKGRGVVSTASYAARIYGIHSAMPISRAFRLCPDGIFVRPRMERYQEVSARVMEVFRHYTPSIQPISLDEAFLDVTGSERLFGNPESMARRIKQEINRTTGLTCSVGISHVKSVAKVASDMDKPDGVTLVPEGTEKAFLAPLEVRKLWGVGPKAGKIMARAHISSVADIQARTREEMIALFGEGGGTHYWNMANAVDLREVCDDEAAMSISHETTFLADEQDPEVLHRTLLWLADKVASRLRRHGLHGRVITLKYRTETFKTFTRRNTLPQCVHDTNSIFETSKALMQKVGMKKGLVRLLGIGVSGLESRQGMQRTLFGGERKSREHATENAVDRVRRKFGSDSIVRGSLLKKKPDEKDLEPGDPGRS